MSETIRIRRTAVLVVALVLLLPNWGGEAHEIPADVTIQGFVKAEGNTIRTLVRVPLVAMRDYNWLIREPGYLVIPDASEMARDAAQQWIANFVRMYEGGVSIGFPTVAASRIAIPGDRAFVSYETALAGVLSPPLAETIDLPLQQAMFDVLLEWPITSETSDFSIEAGWSQLGLRTVTVLRFLRLDPRWHQAALRFVILGFQHILDGIDHLLFLFVLIVPFRRFWTLVPIVTSFTIAHSITLIASAFGLAPSALWFPPLIETLIALSIVFMAFENIIGAKLERRWMVAFGFGLVHGFGFSFALRESLQFAGAHLLTSLLSFNVGVELGQLLVLAITVPVLSLLFKKWLPELMGTIAISAFLAHTGWHWMLDRGTTLMQYQFALPVWNLALAATLLRWVMLALIILGAVWILRGAFGALARRHPVPPAAGGGGPDVGQATSDGTSEMAVGVET
jgi:hypothetical protein